MKVLDRLVRRDEVDDLHKSMTRIEADRFEELRASSRRGWRAFGWTLGAVVALSVAHAARGPFERVFTIVQTVDQNGVIERISTVEGAREEAKAKLIKAFLAQYTFCRMNYSRELLPDQRDVCLLFSAPGEPRRLLDEWFDWRNPTGPYAEFGESGRAITKIKVIELPRAAAQGVATVRFWRSVKRPGDREFTREDWSAQVSYVIPKRATGSDESFLVNPLAGQVLDFVANLETLPKDAPR